MRAIEAPNAKRKKSKTAMTDIEIVRMYVRPMVEAGQTISREEVAEALGFGVHAVQLGIAMERARAEAFEERAPIDKAILSESAAKRFAALERRLFAQFDGVVRERVRQHIQDVVLPMYREKLERAERIINKPMPLTRDELVKEVFPGLHEDTTSPETRHAAFVLLNGRQLQLCPPDREKPLTGDLPATVAELLARRKTKRR